MSKRILIIDNTTAIINPWKQGLANRYKTAEAFGGVEALRKLKAEHFDAVIVNISLRQINGVEAIAKIRGVFDKIPIIILYDKKDVLDLKQAQAYSVDASLSLPVDYKKLLEELEIIFNEKNSAAQPNLALNHLEIKTTSNPKIQSQNTPPLNSNSKNLAADDYIDVEKKYYEALSSISAGELKEAISIFESLIKVTRLKKETWRRLIEESLFQLGQCYAALKQYEKSNFFYAAFINKAPHNSSFKSALLYMGKNYLEMKNKEKATYFLKKVVNLSPADSFTTQARKLLKTIE